MPPVLPPEEWGAKLSEGMRNHAIILIAGVGILVLVTYLAVGTTQSLLRTLRSKRERAGFASNPVLDGYLDDEPRTVAEGVEAAGLEDSVAFARRMAEVKAQFNKYNARLANMSSRYGVDIKEDVLSSGQVFSQAADEYEAKRE